MVEYSVPLALYDFLPVIFTALGLHWVQRMVAFVSVDMGRIAAVGAALVVSGGAAKAVWKLLMAVTSGSLDVRWLDDSLFVFMATGFLLLASSVWGLTRIVRGLSLKPARALAVISVTVTLGFSAALALLLPESPAWSRVLLGAMVTAALAMDVLFVIFTVRERLPQATALMVANVMGTLALSVMARIPDQSVELQWAEQTVNSASWLAFAAATSIIYAHTRARFGVDASRTGALASVREPVGEGLSSSG